MKNFLNSPEKLEKDRDSCQMKRILSVEYISTENSRL